MVSCLLGPGSNKSRTGSPFPVPQACRLEMWEVASASRSRELTQLGEGPQAERIRAGRKRGAKEGASGAQDPRTARQAGFWGVSHPSLPLQPRRSPSQGNPAPRPPRDPEIWASPTRGQAGTASPTQGRSPPATSPALRRAPWDQKMAKTKLSPPTRRTNHTPCVPQPQPPGAGPRDPPFRPPLGFRRRRAGSAGTRARV